jgi:hypothetical protein
LAGSPPIAGGGTPPIVGVESPSAAGSSVPESNFAPEDGSSALEDSSVLVLGGSYFLATDSSVLEVDFERRTSWPEGRVVRTHCSAPGMEAAPSAVAFLAAFAGVVSAGAAAESADCLAAAGSAAPQTSACVPNLH